jgi:hypothetical protein
MLSRGENETLQLQGWLGNTQWGESPHSFERGKLKMTFIDYGYIPLAIEIIK